MKYYGHVYHKETKLPIPGVKVCDGRNIVITDEQGAFTLPGWDKAGVISVQILTHSHDDWFYMIDGHQGNFDFYIQPVEMEGAHSFLHISDTEIKTSECENWLRFTRKCIRKSTPAFLVHTGDICRRVGLENHYKCMNEETIGCPVRYTLGNHDYVDEKYGEYLYERLYGPVWYSFDIGNVHYVVLPIPYGDVPARYTPDDSGKWLRNDLQMMGSEQHLIVLCHNYCEQDEEGFVLQVEGQQLDLKKYGLLAWVFGHHHVHFCNDLYGRYNVATGRPDCGGIDSSPAAVRSITIDEKGMLTTQLMYHVTEPDLKADAYKWQVKLRGRVQFATPIVKEKRMYIATIDDGFPKDCGLFCLDVDNGAQIWNYKTKGSIKNNFSLEHEKLFAQDSLGNVYCLDSTTGKLLWEQSVVGEKHYVVNGLLAAENKVFCSNQDYIFALSQDTGEIIWKMRDVDDGNADGPARFIMAGERLIYSKQWRNIAAFDCETGQVLWVNRDSFCHTSTPTIWENKLYYTASDTVYCVDVKTGKTLRTDCMGESADLNTVSHIVFQGNKGYLSTATRGILEFDCSTMKPVRTYLPMPAVIGTTPYMRSGNYEVQATAVVENNMLIFAACDGYLYIYDCVTGVEMQKKCMGAPSFVTPIVLEDHIITADFDGNITSFAR